MNREHGYILSRMGNAVQTTVWFKDPENMTVEVKGKKSICVHTTMFCITADRRKLLPYVAFKRKHVLQVAQFPDGIFVQAQEKEWMTDDLVNGWLKCVWKKRPGADLDMQFLLVLDSFRGVRMYGNNFAHLERTSQSYPQL